MRSREEVIAGIRAFVSPDSVVAELLAAYDEQADRIRELEAQRGEAVAPYGYAEKKDALWKINGTTTIAAFPDDEFSVPLYRHTPVAAVVSEEMVDAFIVNYHDNGRTENHRQTVRRCLTAALTAARGGG